MKALCKSMCKMTTQKKRRIAFSILIGLVVTSVSGLMSNQSIIGELPNARVVSTPILGVSYWGYVLPWLRQVVYPGAAKTVMWLNFAADVIIWSLIACVVLAVFKLPVAGKTANRRRARRSRRKPRRKPRRRRR